MRTAYYERAVPNENPPKREERGEGNEQRGSDFLWGVRKNQASADSGKKSLEAGPQPHRPGEGRNYNKTLYDQRKTQRRILRHGRNMAGVAPSKKKSDTDHLDFTVKPRSEERSKEKKKAMIGKEES